MDQAHGLNFLVMRPWLLGSALTDLIITVTMITMILLYLAKIIGEEKFSFI